MMGTDRTDHLPLWLVVLGWFMRRMPRGPRKLEWWWWKLFTGIGAGSKPDDPGERDWPSHARPFTIRGRHGVRMVTTLGHWYNRWEYFRGSYFQDHIVCLMENLIRRGDAFVDVGANWGRVTSLAARLTGPSGPVYAFEPRPGVVERLEHEVKLNNVKNVKIFNFGISDREGQAVMVDTPNPAQGWISLGGVPEGEKGLTVRLAKGDDILGELDPSRPVIMKMDVEGHEVHALHGLSRFLERRELALICEVNADALSWASSSPDELFELLKGHGFRAFQFEPHQTRWRRILRLIPLDEPPPWDNYDALFLKPGTALWHRLGPEDRALPPDAGGAVEQGAASQGRAADA